MLEQQEPLHGLGSVSGRLVRLCPVFSLFEQTLEHWHAPLYAREIWDYIGSRYYWPVMLREQALPRAASVPIRDGTHKSLTSEAGDLRREYDRHQSILAREVQKQKDAEASCDKDMRFGITDDRLVECWRSPNMPRQKAIAAQRKARGHAYQARRKLEAELEKVEQGLKRIRMAESFSAGNHWSQEGALIGAVKGLEGLRNVELYREKVLPEKRWTLQDPAGLSEEVGKVKALVDAAKPLQVLSQFGKPSPASCS